MTDLRRCSGSKTFGIAAHEAPLADFPAQPSRKDGLGTMCKPHWREYTRALGQARRAKMVPPGEVTQADPDRLVKPARRRKGQPEPIKTRPARKAPALE